MTNKYEEALERARRFYDANTNSGYREIFEEIFPELKESEDESIRKRIGKILVNSGYASDNELFAWLEKQKPVEWSEKNIEALRIAIMNIEDMPAEDVYCGCDMNFKETAKILRSLKQRLTT